VTREELRAMGFSEAVINDQLGEPELKYDRAETAHIWKFCSNKKTLTVAQDKELKERMEEYASNGDYALPKLKYKIIEG